MGIWNLGKMRTVRTYVRTYCTLRRRS